MKNLARNVIISMLCLLMVISSGFSFVLAGTPQTDNSCPESGPALDACYTTPDEVTDYISTMNNLINTISLSTEGYGTGDPYESEIYKAGKSLGTVGLNVLDGTAVTTVLFAVITADFGVDIFDNFIVMSNGGAVVRDWEKIIIIDEILSKKIQQVGWTDTTFKTIKDAGELQQLNSLFADLDFVDVELVETTKYIDVLKLLRAIQSFYKNIYLDATGSSKTILAQGFDYLTYGLSVAKKKLHHTMNITVNIQNIQNYKNVLHGKYRCAAGISNNCPSGFKQFKDSVNHIIELNKDSAGGAFKKVKDSGARLEDVLKHMTGTPSNNSDYLKRKDKLLRQYYGSNSDDILKCSENPDCMRFVGMARNKMQDAAREFNQGIKNATESLAGLLSNEKPEVGEPTINVGQYAQDKSREQLSENIYNTISGIVKQHKRHTTNVLMEDPNSVTLKFPNLSRQVYEGINVIGNTDEKKGIIQEMGEACENQCVNFGGICWYY